VSTYYKDDQITLYFGDALNVAYVGRSVVGVLRMEASLAR